MKPEIDWTRKSKKYKTKYFHELGRLCGEVKDEPIHAQEGLKFDQGEEIEGGGRLPYRG